MAHPLELLRLGADVVATTRRHGPGEGSRVHAGMLSARPVGAHPAIESRRTPCAAKGPEIAVRSRLAPAPAGGAFVAGSRAADASDARRHHSGSLRRPG